MRVRAVVLSLLVAGACSSKGGPTSSSSSSGGSTGDGWDAAVTYDAAGLFPDAGERLDAGPGCGAVPSAGECDDAGVLRWCEGRTVRSSDCAARGRTCGLQRSLGGSWCIGVRGGDCEVTEVDACPEGVPCIDQVCGGPVDAGASSSSSGAASSSSG